MKIWWCEEHKASGPLHESYEDFSRCYEWWVAEAGGDEYPLLATDCRMVEMQLVPADAELQCPNCKFVYEVAT